MSYCFGPGRTHPAHSEDIVEDFEQSLALVWAPPPKVDFVVRLENLMAQAVEDL